MSAVYTSEAIDALMAKTFHAGRQACSKEYKHGVRVLLNSQLAGMSFPFLPYKLGTAAADAYLAGQDEGRAIVDSERAAKATGGAA